MKTLKNKFMAIKTRVKATILHIVLCIVIALTGAKKVFASNKAEGFTDTAVKILIAVVIGALLLAGLYLLFSGTVLPTLTSRIKDLFSYTG